MMKHIHFGPAKGSRFSWVSVNLVVTCVGKLILVDAWHSPGGFRPFRASRIRVKRGADAGLSAHSLLTSLCFLFGLSYHLGWQCTVLFFWTCCVSLRCECLLPIAIIWKMAGYGAMAQQGPQQAACLSRAACIIGVALV